MQFSMLLTPLTSLDALNHLQFTLYTTLILLYLLWRPAWSPLEKGKMEEPKSRRKKGEAREMRRWNYIKLACCVN